MKHIVIAPEGIAAPAHQAFLVPDTRGAIELAVDAFLSRLDEMDGDPDIELNGDELDGDASEDEFMHHGGGIGCPIADPGEYASTEWHTRGRHKDRDPSLRPEVFAYHEDSEDDDPLEVTACERSASQLYNPGAFVPDDAEDDDPAGGNVTDEPHDPESDFDASEATMRSPCYGIDQSKGPLDGRVRDNEGERGDSDPSYSTAPRTSRWIDPATMPDFYALQCVGNCLEPIFRDGCTLAFTKTVRPEPGDYVAVLFREGVRPLSEPQGFVKRLVSSGPEGFSFFDFAPASELWPVVVVEMLNPPKRLYVRGNMIAAIHKCLGEAGPAVDGMCAVPTDILPPGAVDSLPNAYPRLAAAA